MENMFVVGFTSISVGVHMEIRPQHAGVVSDCEPWWQVPSLAEPSDAVHVSLLVISLCCFNFLENNLPGNDLQFW